MRKSPVAKESQLTSLHPLRGELIAKEHSCFKWRQFKYGNKKIIPSEDSGSDNILEKSGL